MLTKSQKCEPCAPIFRSIDFRCSNLTPKSIDTFAGSGDFSYLYKANIDSYT